MNFSILHFAKTAVLLCIFAMCSSTGFSQTVDTLVLNNGDAIIGEVKEMKNAVIQFETPYSDSDFKIEWDQVREIYTSTFFLVNLDNGVRINGILRSIPGDTSVVQIITDDGRIETADVDDIVFLQSVKKNLWSRFDANIEFGLNLTKANNLRQFSSRAGLGYTGNTWGAQASYNTVNSNQDSVAATKRTDANIGAQWYLKNDWYIAGDASFLQADEQQLKLRATPRLGFGKYFVRNNHWFLAADAGLAMNIETFQNDEEDRQSLEAYLSTRANLFNTGDLSSQFRGTIFPSLTESGRFRSDITWDLKYDILGSDFYVKFGVTFNYDSEPALDASTTDYVFQTTFGWEL